MIHTKYIIEFIKSQNQFRCLITYVHTSLSNVLDLFYVWNKKNDNLSYYNLKCTKTINSIRVMYIKLPIYSNKQSIYLY